MALKKSKQDHKQASTKQVAAIFGVTGLVGRELARKLTSIYSWKVYGIARREPKTPIKKPNKKNYHFISCDLLCPFDTQKKLSSLEDVTHIFWVTWAYGYPLDSPECCEQNREMLSNVLDVILPKAKCLQHLSLQTGMKHYISFTGPKNFRNINTSVYDEDCPRAFPGNNFYHALEDLLKERLPNNKVAWSVQRPGLITGSSDRTIYNFMGCIAVYGTICKYLDLPFVFGGSRECWESAWIDVSDARLVAEQHIWASTEDHGSSEGQAYNAINGACFTWKEIWPGIGKMFGLEVPENMFSPELLYTKSMADKGKIWKEIVAKKGLVETAMEELANWTFLDLLFRCPLRLLGTRHKADRLGFRLKYTASESILYWIDYMRDEKFIP